MDLARRRLPLRTMRAGLELYRIHRSDASPLFFGPPSEAPESRFDDPSGEFKVCYLAERREGAFVETLLRGASPLLLSWSDLESRSIARVEVLEPLRLVEFLGPALRRLGGTAEVAATRDYTLSWAWARALWEHPSKPDGIVYRCRHDDSLLGVALFDRAGHRVALRGSVSLASELHWLGELSERYGFGLTV